MTDSKKEDEISLWLCNKCRKQIFQDEIERGQSCNSCGSRHVSPAPPTFRYISGYLAHNPRLLPKFFRENTNPTLGR